MWDVRDAASCPSPFVTAVRSRTSRTSDCLVAARMGEGEQSRIGQNVAAYTEDTVLVRQRTGDN